MTKHYADVKAKPDFVEVEKEVLRFWEEDKTFEKSVRNRDGAAEFVFYDGPPFANGTPHYGHIMVSYVKDVVARFQTMNGKKSSVALAGTVTAFLPKCLPKNSLAFPDASRLRNSELKSLMIFAVPTF